MIFVIYFEGKHVHKLGPATYKKLELPLRKGHDAKKGTNRQKSFKAALQATPAFM